MLLFVINEGLDGFRFRPLSPRYLHIALHQGHAEKDYETGGNSKLFVPENELKCRKKAPNTKKLILLLVSYFIIFIC
jgi:hypothetical protein